MAIEVGFKASFRRLTDALIAITDIARDHHCMDQIASPFNMCADFETLARGRMSFNFSNRACTRSKHDLQVVSYNQT